MKFGRANGYGIFDNKYLFYKGEFKDNHKHGKGVEKSHNGDYFFDGTFEYDQKEKGTLRYQNVVYEGTFLDDLYHGEGKLTNPQGVYKGQFKDGKQHGYGEFEWTDGSKYRGNFSRGMKEGEGEYFNAKNSTVARGFWKSNKLNGNGQYIDTHGERYACVWENNKIAEILL